MSQTEFKNKERILGKIPRICGARELVAYLVMAINLKWSEIEKKWTDIDIDW